MNFVDVFYLSQDGLRLYLRDYGEPNANAPVVLCLPGLTRNSKDFANLAESLRLSYRVLCPDQRGRGRSQRDADSTRYRPEQYVVDMLEMLNQLGIAKVIVIGTSLGGMMAMRLMAVAPTRVTAVILNDVGPVVEPHGLKRIAGYVGKTAAFSTWQEAAEQIAKINGVAFPNYSREDWINMAHNVCMEQDNMIVLDYDPAIALGVAAGTAATNLWPLFDAIPPKPMLVIRGEISDILSAETQQEMVRRLPMVTAVSIAERGHAPTLDEPDSRLHIQQFLTGLAA